jgi:hypothetical protein
VDRRTNLGSRFDLIRHDMATGLKLYIVEGAAAAGGDSVIRYLFVGPASLPTGLPDGAIDRASAERTFEAVLTQLRQRRWTAQTAGCAAPPIWSRYGARPSSRETA